MVGGDIEAPDVEVPLVEEGRAEALGARDASVDRGL